MEGLFQISIVDNIIFILKIRRQDEKPDFGRMEQVATDGEISFVAPHTPSGALQLPETDPEEWDYKKHRWTYRHSSLSTFRWYVSNPIFFIT